MNKELSNLNVFSGQKLLLTLKPVKGKDERKLNPYTPVKCTADRPEIKPKPHVSQKAIPTPSSPSSRKRSANNCNTIFSSVVEQVDRSVPKSESSPHDARGSNPEIKMDEIIKEFDDSEYIDMNCVPEMKGDIPENDDDDDDKYYYFDIDAKLCSRKGKKWLEGDMCENLSFHVTNDELSDMLYLDPRNILNISDENVNASPNEFEGDCGGKIVPNPSSKPVISKESLYYDLPNSSVLEMEEKEVVIGERTRSFHKKSVNLKGKSLKVKKLSKNVSQMTRDEMFVDFSTGSELAKLGERLRKEYEAKVKDKTKTKKTK